MQKDTRSAIEVATSGPVTGSSLRLMRESLGLSNALLATLLDTWPETLSRWENGTQTLDHRAFVLVALLVLEAAEQPGNEVARTRTYSALLALRRPTEERDEDARRRAMIKIARSYVSAKSADEGERAARWSFTREVGGFTRGQLVTLKKQWADEERDQIKAHEASRVAVAVDALVALDPLFTKEKRKIESVLRSTQLNSATALAARIGWAAGIEGDLGPYSKVQKRIEARYHRAERAVCRRRARATASAAA